MGEIKSCERRPHCVIHTQTLRDNVSFNRAKKELKAAAPQGKGALAAVIRTKDGMDFSTIVVRNTTLLTLI